MEKKEIKKRRMWNFFIDATEELIREEGMQKVTIRKVADRAGYNSATIYSYFNELSHLLFFASLRLYKPYLATVTSAMDNLEDPLEKYYVAWEYFCEYSFKQPEVFKAIFLMDLGEHPQALLQHYYEMYPADLITVPQDLQAILMDRNLFNRGRYSVIPLVKAGLLKSEAAEELNELTNLVWLGMFTNFLNNRGYYSIEEAHRQTMKYVKEVTENALKK
ncbi:TetR/AcrR family transcriptional regulator [Planococcus lenghuensis]|uniref:TetR family transcriptional regulator n=1 Tax=Planococcus lenghuensis TaxID=2213202 RepID=A0A1Q2L2Y2_9BACL|nr:TetR/AcrR family transcriptional regulator [Planococcus lenghuensis]AQQ54800.1 TetR family transcriptional regulator [Planococcus lenghuensis]